MTEFRVPLPFPCVEPRRLSPLTDPFRLEEDGRRAVLYLPEGSIVNLSSLYGLPSSRENTVEPYLKLEWTLPEHGPKVALFWNGDGTYDGWEFGTNFPAVEPRKATKATKAMSVGLEGGATWVHPDAAWAALDKLMPDSRAEDFDTDWYYLRSAVSLVSHIGTHPAGTESIVQQVRLYRRRLKERRT